MMIYVEEKSQVRQLDLIRLFLDLGGLDAVYWLYQEYGHESFLGNSLAKSPQGKPVTLYGDGTMPKCTSRAPLSMPFIQSAAGNITKIKECCDSLCIYRESDHDWLISTVGHEGMCLVSEDSHLEKLVNAGFNASTTAPDWW